MRSKPTRVAGGHSLAESGMEAFTQHQRTATGTGSQFLGTNFIGIAPSALASAPKPKLLYKACGTRPSAANK